MRRSSFFLFACVVTHVVQGWAQSNDPASIPKARSAQGGDAAQKAAAPEGDPVVIKKDGIELRRSEVARALRTLPPQYQKMPLSDIFPLLVHQLLYNPDGPMDALRD